MSRTDPRSTGLVQCPSGGVGMVMRGDHAPPSRPLGSGPGGAGRHKRSGRAHPSQGQHREFVKGCVCFGEHLVVLEPDDCNPLRGHPRVAAVVSCLSGGVDRPPTSMTRRASRQWKSATHGPVGCCQRPGKLRPVSGVHLGDDRGDRLMSNGDGPCSRERRRLHARVPQPPLPRPLIAIRFAWPPPLPWPWTRERGATCIAGRIESLPRALHP